MVSFWIVMDFYFSLCTCRNLFNIIWTFTGYTLSLWTHKSLCGNVVDNHGFSFWVCELAGIYVVLFWTFKDFNLNLWTYKSPCGNVVDSPRFSFDL